MAKDRNGSEEKRPKKKLKRLYDGADQDQQPSLANAREEGPLNGWPVQGASDSLPQDTTDGGSQEFQPGPTFTRSWAASTLPCTGLDPATHEIWLLQLPLDWRFDAEVILDVKRGTGPGDPLAACIDSRGDRFSVSEEHPSLASSLYVASPALKDDLPPRVQRRVTLAREDPALRELPAAGVTLKERQGAEAAGGTADEHAGAAKRGAANVAPKQERGSLQAPQAELRMEDILGEPPMTTQVGQAQDGGAELEAPGAHQEGGGGREPRKKKKKRSKPKEESK